MPGYGFGYGYEHGARAGASSGAIAASLLANDGHVAWYTDPRGIMAGGLFFYSTVSGNTTGGNIEAHRVNADRTVSSWYLAQSAEVDDHNNASFLLLSTGQIVVFYGRHTDNLGTRYRVSIGSAPNIIGFGPEKYIPVLAPAATVSYSHPFLLTDGKIYLMRRTNLVADASRDQQLCVTTEASLLAGTEVWTSTTIFMDAGPQRPYAKFAINNAGDGFYVLSTNVHPAEDNDCSIFASKAVLVAGTLTWKQMDGTNITAPFPFDVATNMTLIQANTAADVNECWTMDIAVGPDDHPRWLWSRYPGGGGPYTNIQYWHGRWTGAATVNTLVSENNESLIPNQLHYMPGACFDGNDVTKLYMSEDPIAGIAEIGSYIFDEGTNTLGPRTAITSGSAHDNMRPSSPKGHGVNDAVQWIRPNGIGYIDYFNYEASAYTLGPITQPGPPPSYEAETDAFLARLTVQPSAAEKDRIDRFIKRLKNGPVSGSNIFAKADAIYLPLIHDEAAARTNIVSAAHPLTVVGAPVFVAGKGYRGNNAPAVGDYLSGPTPAALTQFAQNSATMIAHVSKPITGQSTGSVIRRLAAGSPVLLQFGTTRLNTGSGTAMSPVPIAVQGGIIGAVRSGATAGFNKEGTTSLNANATASAAKDTAPLLFCYENTAFTHSVFLGAYLTDNEYADAANAMWEYARSWLAPPAV